MLNLVKEGISSGILMEQALELCKEYGRPLTRNQLELNGLKHDLCGRFPGDRRIFFVKDRLVSWLKRLDEAKAQGWEKVGDIARDLGLSPFTIYTWAYRKKINSLHLEGLGKVGGLCVKRAEVEKVRQGRNPGSPGEEGQGE